MRIFRPSLKLQKDRTKFVGGVARTRCILPIHICSILALKILLKYENVTKNQDFENKHAYLQTIISAPLKFQTDRTKTIGGVARTMSHLGIRNQAPCITHHGKPKIIPSLLYRKAGDKKYVILYCRMNHHGSGGSFIFIDDMSKAVRCGFSCYCVSCPFICRLREIELSVLCRFLRVLVCLVKHQIMCKYMC